MKQAIHFSDLAPNMQVKIPVTNAGVQAIEEATYAGVTINATVSFTVPQMIAVAEAVERGLKRRDAEGLDTVHMSPVCTMMIGRLDDWMQVLIKRDNIDIDPVLRSLGRHRRVQEGLRDLQGARLPYPAALSRIPPSRPLVRTDRRRPRADHSVRVGPEDQRLGHSCVERMQNPVDPQIVDALYTKIPDFRRAYDEDGMTPGGVRRLRRVGRARCAASSRRYTI